MTGAEASKRTQSQAEQNGTLLQEMLAMGDCMTESPGPTMKPAFIKHLRELGSPNFFVQLMINLRLKRDKLGPTSDSMIDTS